MRQGGNVFSLDQYYGQTTGLYPESIGVNDLGNPIRNTIANGGGIILPGVLPNGTPNNIRLDTSANGYLGYSNMPNSVFVYDASFVKLRQASISYSLPKKMLENTFIQGVTFSAVGNNLWIIKSMCLMQIRKLD